MKCYISTRERWPDFDLLLEKAKYNEGTVELTKGEWERWQTIRNEFNLWQERIYNAHKQAMND